MLPRRDELFDTSARTSLRSLLGIAITANGNLCTADCVVALAVTSVDSRDCEKLPKSKGNSGLSASIHLGFSASWHSACYSKHRLVVPTTEAWARGPNLTVSGRGRTMSEFAAGFRARHGVEERRRSVWSSRPPRTCIHIHAVDKTTTFAFRRHSSAAPPQGFLRFFERCCLLYQADQRILKAPLSRVSVQWSGWGARS